MNMLRENMSLRLSVPLEKTNPYNRKRATLPVMSDVMTEYWDKNRIALSTKDPALAIRLAGERAPGQASAYMLETARSGVPTVAFRDPDENLKYLHSQYDPWREAETLACANHVGSHAFFIVIGFGLGYHICELFKRLHEAQQIIIIEPAGELLRAALTHADYSEMLQDERLHIICEREAPVAIERLKTLLARCIAHDASSLGYSLISFYDRWDEYALYARELKGCVPALIAQVQERRAEIYASIDELRVSGLGKTFLGEYKKALAFFRTQIIDKRELTRAETGLLITYYLLSHDSYAETFARGKPEG